LLCADAAPAESTMAAANTPERTRFMEDLPVDAVLFSRRFVSCRDHAACKLQRQAAGPGRSGHARG
jgi:hypothetical protein